MIITFATQKEEQEKRHLPLHLPITFLDYQKGKLKVYDFDFQNHFTTNGKKTNSQTFQNCMKVETIGEDEEQPFSDFETLINLKRK